MKTVLIIIGVIAALFIILVIYSRLKLKGLENVPPHEEILILTDKNFNHQLKGKLVLVDFWAEWCAPCKLMLPILNDVASSSGDSFKVAKVDVDKNQSLAQKYGIRSIPTLIAFKDGKEAARFVGVKNKNFLLKEMEKLA
ncbi:MAG: thioredoxin [Bacteroidales bacterium]|nr:thioredoxin [Bacteroidales bacterium]